jgi:hypothetical protein
MDLPIITNYGNITINYNIKNLTKTTKGLQKPKTVRLPCLFTWSRRYNHECSLKRAIWLTDWNWNLVSGWTTLKPRIDPLRHTRGELTLRYNQEKQNSLSFGRTLSFSCKWKRKPLPKSVQSNEQCSKYYLQLSTIYGFTKHHKLWKYYHQLQYQKFNKNY